LTSSCFKDSKEVSIIKNYWKNFKNLYNKKNSIFLFFGKTKNKMKKNIIWKIITQMWSVFFMIVPVSIFFFITKNYFVTATLILLLILTDGAASLIKLVYFKDRPKKMDYKNIIQRLLASSFPSIHSSRTFSVFLYSVIILGGLYSGIFFVYFLLVAISRIVLQKHFLHDVLWWIVLSTTIFVVYMSYFQWYGNFRIEYILKSFWLIS